MSIRKDDATTTEVQPKALHRKAVIDNRLLVKSAVMQKFSEARTIDNFTACLFYYTWRLNNILG